MVTPLWFPLWFCLLVCCMNLTHFDLHFAFIFHLYSKNFTKVSSGFQGVVVPKRVVTRDTLILKEFALVLASIDRSHMKIKPVFHL